MEQNNNNENLPHLPFDIIIKILNRLPVRCLFRFHCVCKSWRSLLQLSTREMSIHFNKICNKKYTLMRNADTWYPHDVIWKFKIPFELISLDFMLLSPVKGILCVCGPFRSYISFVYLWNPLTKEYKALPKPIVHLQYLLVNFGFGFVPKSNDFKVVKVLQHEWKSNSRIEIYSLNRDSWSRVSDSYSSNEITEKERDVSVNRSVRTHATLAIDLEKEVIIEANCWNHCETITWSNEMDAMWLTLPEDDLVLRNKEYVKNDSSYHDGYSSKRFLLLGALFHPTDITTILANRQESF